MQLLLTLQYEAASAEAAGDFECFSQWWEVDKAHIRVFCQQYTSHSTTQVKQTIKQLEGEIRHVEDSLCI